MDQILRSALAQRLGQHLQSLVQPVENLGNLPQMDRGEQLKALLGAVLAGPRAGLSDVGLAREGLDTTAKAIGGELSLLPALAQVAGASHGLPGFDPNGTATQASQLVLNQGPAHPGRAIDAFRNGPDSLAAWLAGGLELASNPTNYIPGVGPEERAAQQAGRISSGLGIDLSTVNSILYPEQLVVNKALGLAGGVAKKVLTQSALVDMLRQRYALPTAPEAADYAQYAEKLGLPVPAKVGSDASVLAPEGTPNILTMARQAAARNAANAQPSLFDLGDNAGATQARLFDDRLQPTAPTGPLADLLGTPTPPAAIPAQQPIDLLRNLLQTGDSGKGMVYPPNDPNFYAGRTGIDPAAIPALLDQLRTEGALASDGKGGMINALLTGGDRTPTPAVAPDQPGGSLELPAMPAYSGTKAEALGQLSSDEIDQLVNLAYPTTAAQAGAITKYPNPNDLAGAALDRIQTDRTLVQNLATQYPDLAGKVAYLPDALTPTPAPGGPAGGVIDWLRNSPVAGAPQISRLGIGGSGGLVGAAAGGIMPASSDEERRQHALEGAALGVAGGLGATTGAGQNILKALPTAKDFGGTLLADANAAQRAAMDRPSVGIGNLGAMVKVWRVQATSTLRNLLQDEGTARLWNANAGVRARLMNDNWSSMVQLRNLGMKDGYDALPIQTTSELDKWGKTGYVPDVGASFNTINKKMTDEFSAIDLAKAEAILSGLNPTQGGIPVAGVALGAIKGYTRAWQESLFSTLNEFTRVASRHAVFQDEFAPAVQVAAQHFVDSNGLTGVLDPAAGFTPADVEAAAGTAAKDAWNTQLDKVLTLSEDRAKDIHGDFSTKDAGTGQRTAGQLLAQGVGTVIPFSSWALKAYPRTVQMMLDHPGVSLAIMLLTLNQAASAQKEGKSGLVGGIPIDKNTSLVGGLADKLLGGLPGQVYVNALGSLTPVSTSALLSPDMPVNANAYQQVSAGLDRAGFSFNPIIQALAYATNKDYQRPSPLSRTAGLEAALPGPQMPSLALGPLNAARTLAGGSASNATPEDRRLAEVFYLATGHDISDPTNQTDPQRAALLASTLDPNSPIRKLVAQSVGQGNVARNLVSLVSPVGVQAAPTVEQQAEAASYAARHAPPAKYDPRTINALMNSGNMAQYIEAIMRQRANVGTQGEIAPLLQLTSGGSGQDRAQAYLSSLGSNSLFGSPLIGAPQSLINQLLGLSTPSVEISGPTGGQR